MNLENTMLREESRHKRPYVVQSHLYQIYREKANGKENSGCLDYSGENAGWSQRSMRDFEVMDPKPDGGDDHTIL